MADLYQGNMGLHAGGAEINTLDFIVRQVIGKMVTATTVLVKAVNTTAKTVDIQPMVNQLDGFGNAVPHGVIHNAPYLRLQGGGNAVIIDPAVGDIGIAVFGHSDISSVKQNKAISNPGSRRRFNWSDAMYIGGILNGAPTQVVRLDSTGITITSADGKPVTINAPGGANITAPTVAIDGDATISGNLSVSGKTTTADLSATGTVDLADATVSGAMSTADITSSGTISASVDVFAAGKSGAHHTHGGVSTGSGNTGEPA